MTLKDVKVIGGAKNFWLYSEEDGYDLTHPPKPDASPISPRLRLQTRESHVSIDPKKTALVAIDLQNYFLSPALGRPANSAALEVVERLTKQAIPACRKLNIPILWLRWGLTEQDIEEMPPTIIKGFAMDDNFEHGRKIPGLGEDIGPVTLDDGSTIEAGRVLMPNQWNSEFYAPLVASAEPNDLHVDKNRISGFWGGTKVEEVLNSRNIKTLIFSGCNLDQCVASSLTDAVWQGWDCLLLTDGSSTTSPEFARREVEFNMGGWGFLLTCKDLADGADNMDG